MNLRKLLSAILVVSLVFGLVSSALADGYTPGSAFDAAERMAKLGLVKGREPGDYALNETITRAEMVTILVRALGQESTAQLLAGAPAFADTNNHWASGYVALAKNLGITAGRTPTTFEPDAPVTSAEAVAFLVKFLGLPVNDELGWPNSYLAAALEAGIATTDDNLAGIANSPAPRGMVFFFGDKAFSNVKLDNGKTVYQTYVDSEPPTLSVDSVAAVTAATSVTITGKVAGHTALNVGGAAVTTNFDGSFSASVALEPGENKIVVSAVDAVGNVATKEVTVTREFGAAAAIEAADITVAAGAEVEVAAAVKDASGATITNAAVEGESAVGTYADGKFTAGTKAGKGTLTLRSGDAVATVNVTVTAGALAKVTSDKASVEKGEKATLTAVDEHGNAIAGAEYSVDSSDAVIVNGAFVGTKAGKYTVTAKVGEATATTSVGVYSDTVDKLTVSELATAVGNEATEYEVTVSAVDENGSVVGSFDGADSKFVWKGTNLVTVTAVDANAKKGVQKFKLTFDESLAGTEVKLAFEQDGKASVKGHTFVEVLPQVATAIKVVSADEYVTANDGGSPATLLVEVVDQVGEPMVSDIYELKATISGSARLWSGTENKTELTVLTGDGSDDADAQSQATINLRSLKGQTGDATVTVSAEGMSSATVTLKAAIAGTAKAVQVSANKDSVTVADDEDDSAKVVTYTVRLVDANGVPVIPSADTKVNLDVDTDDFALIQVGGAALEAKTGNDVGNLTVGAPKLEVTTVSELAATIKFTFKVTDMTSASVSTTFNAGTATKIAVTTTATEALPVQVAASKPEAQITVQLKDAFDNKVAKAGVELTVKAQKGAEDTTEVKINGKEKTNKVTTDANGSATFTLSTLPYVGAVYNFTVTGSDLTADTGYVAVENTVATTVSVTLVDRTTNENPLNMQAGGRINISAQVKDGFGTVLTDDQIAVGYLKLYVNDKEVENPGFAFADGKFTVSNYEVKKAGTNTIKVAVSGAAGTIEGSRNLSVRASTASTEYTATQATADKTYSGTDYKAATIAKNTVTSLTLRATDGFGNLKTLSAARKLTVSVEKRDGNNWVALGSTVFEVRTSADGSNKLNTADAFSISSSSTMYVLAGAGTFKVTVTDDLDPANTGVFVIVSE